MTEGTSVQQQERREPRLPWHVFLFLLGVFAVTSFDPFLSADYVARRDETVEARLEASIRRTEAGNVSRQVALLSLGGLAVISLLRRQRNPLGINGTLGALIVLFLLWAALLLVLLALAGCIRRRGGINEQSGVFRPPPPHEEKRR